MAKKKKAKKVEAGHYDASSIQAMEGVEHIRKRPGMYIPDTGKQGLHHIAWEIIDNVVDEWIAGHCTTLNVDLDTKKQTVTVTDDGRGIPVEIHKQTGAPAIEGIFTRTMMGGKFGSQAYAISGGLHGVGAKATCALSDSMWAETVRKGKVHRVEFSRGKVTAKTKAIGKAKKRKGTVVSFHPDRTVFGKHNFDPDLFRERLTSRAYLCPGLNVVLTINGKKTTLTSNEGLAGFVKTRLGRKEEPLQEAPITFRVYGEFDGRKFKAHKKKKPDSEAIDVAFWWTNGDGEKWWSWVNMITVKDGGTHVVGIKTAITRVLRGFCEEDGVSGDDFREGLRIAVHVMLKEPHFEGQAKNRLNNPEVRGMADSAFNEAFSLWASKNSDVVQAMVARATELYKARKAYKTAKSVATQSAYADTKNQRRGLPPKLVTALQCSKNEREVFIVEGASAGGNAVVGRGKNDKGVLFQEVLPLRGKPPNSVMGIVDRKTGAPKLGKIAKFFENEELESIVRAVGAGHDLTVPGESCDPSKARVSKIILLADADADGGHIATLLMAFFLRYMMPVVEAGMLWVAMPPLYVAKWPKGRAFGNTLEEVRNAARDQGYKGKSDPTITRLKGLGEMQAVELSITAMNPETRNLRQISADRSSVEYVLDLLGSSVATRKDLLGLLD